MEFTDTPIKIDLQKLSEIFHPFQSCIWVKCYKPITRYMIRVTVENKDFQSPEVPVEYDLIWDISDRRTHIKRIAWLVDNWSDKNPIEIDFGIPELGIGFFEVGDGNHRLLAAYYLNKPYIMAHCSGSISEIEKYTYYEHNTTIPPSTCQ